MSFLWLPAAVFKSVTEEDEHRIAQRQKQVEFGKNTPGYERYLAAIPRCAVPPLCVHACMYVYVYIRACVYSYLCVCVCICVCVRAC